MMTVAKFQQFFYFAWVSIVKQPCPFDKNNAKTELGLLLNASKTKLKHLNIKFRSSDKTYLL